MCAEAAAVGVATGAEDADGAGAGPGLACACTGAKKKSPSARATAQRQRGWPLELLRARHGAAPAESLASCYGVGSRDRSSRAVAALGVAAARELHVVEDAPARRVRHAGRGERVAAHRRHRRGAAAQAPFA